MYLTPYTMLSEETDSADPLGFLRPSQALVDLLLPQFTTLTAHPTYHGFLCCATRILKDRGLSVTDRGFSHAVRDLEILWGMLCMKSARTGGLLNVTKLKNIPLHGLTLEKARKQKALYLRLGYGTLGHYLVPSMTWSFFDRQRNLTPAGEELGRAWSARRAGSGKNASFEALAERWLKGEAVPDKADEALCLALSVEAGMPGEEEQALWRRAFHGKNERMPEARELWTSPPPPSPRPPCRKATAWTVTHSFRPSGSITATPYSAVIWNAAAPLNSLPPSCNAPLNGNMREGSPPEHPARFRRIRLLPERSAHRQGPLFRCLKTLSNGTCRRCLPGWEAIRNRPPPSSACTSPIRSGRTSCPSWMRNACFCATACMWRT